jgi:prolyl oligopeptidase
MRKHLLTIAFCGLAASVLMSCAQPGDTPIVYPESERGDVVENYFGDEVADPYRWLEDLDGEATTAWVEAQNAISFPYLEAISQREAIENRLTELWNYERYGLPDKEGGRYFFERNDGLQNQDVLYVADSIDGEPRILIDPNTFSEDATVALANWYASPDGKWLAYGRHRLEDLAHPQRRYRRGPRRRGFSLQVHRRIVVAR